MKKYALLIAAAGALWGAGSGTPASAQWIVEDPGNLVENIISALENTQAVLHQVTQISNEVKSLAYQAQNLQQMPAALSSGVLNQYTAQFGQLVTAMQSVNGIAQNVSTLTTRYNSTYPNTALAQGPLSTANVLAQLTAWLNQSRSVYQGAYNTQAQVIGSLGADTTTMRALMQSSTSSQGALDAIQTGNQITGQVASQLMKLNQQMAATNQAQMNWIAQQTQLMAQAQERSNSINAGYSARAVSPVNLNYDRIH